jgi:hypothetical protein
MPPKGYEMAALVLHNNSDGFGDNIKNEKGKGSMDAAVGQFSDAAHKLRQDPQRMTRVV